jgi:hypothetical protein
LRKNKRTRKRLMKRSMITKASKDKKHNSFWKNNLNNWKRFKQKKAIAKNRLRI